ncbi:MULTISPECIES: Ig-like domain-containing protein, partial [unclassified Listeria]|uniref:Ig-like domain-containing protein n=1 Tax=unclassified Listeria TaxID=2642072 RepID=UPI000B5918AE
MRKSKLKKIVISTITTTMVASTIATAFPFNALTVRAADSEAQTPKLKSGVLQSNAANLLKNSNFNGISNWDFRIWDGANAYNGGTTVRSYDYNSSDGSYAINGYRPNTMSVKPQGNGSMDIWMNRTVDNGPAGNMFQSVNTIAGHRYTLNYTVINQSNSLFKVHALDGYNNISANAGTLATTGSSWSANYGTQSLTFTARSNFTTISFDIFRSANTGSTRFSNLSLVDIDNMDETTINPLTTNSLTAQGTAEPNASLVITAGGTTLTTTTVNSDGTYNVTIPKQAAGTIVTAVATINGQSKSAQTTVSQGSIAQTTINPLTTDSTLATGRGEPGASLVIRNQSGNQIGTGQILENGTYSVTIPKQVAGTIVTATATKNGQTSSANTTVTQGNIAPTTINALTTDSVKAEGTAEPGATLVIRNQFGNQLATGSVQPNGTYSVTIPKQIAGTIVTATATKNGENESASTTVTQGNIAQTTINALNTDSVTAEGTAEPNADIVIKAGLTTLASGRVGSDGNYNFLIPKQIVGTIVTATATIYGKSSSANTTVTQGNIAPTTIKPLTTDSLTAEGTAEPNAILVLKDQNNNQIANGRIGSDGKYSVVIPKQAAGTVVTATATKDGQTSSASTTVTQDSIAQTTINALNTNSTVAQGKAEPNAAIAIKVGSSTIGEGRVGSDGNYSVTIPKQAAGVTVIATATAGGKTSSANTTVISDEIAQTTINPLNTDSVRAEGTAEPNASLVLRDQNNNQIALGRVGSDGNYSVTIPKQLAGTVVTATATLDGKTSSSFTVVTNDTIEPTTINSLTVDSVTASGTGEPNASLILRDQNNNQIASGRIGSDGIYTVTISKQAEGTVVTATATANGKTSSANTTVISDRIAQTTINSLTTDSRQATGTGEPNATLVLRDQNNNQIASGRIGSDGRYTMAISQQALGTVVTATATLNGKTSSANTTVTGGATIAQTTIEPLTTASTIVRGTAEPNANMVIKAGTTTIAVGQAGSDGTYTFIILPQAEGTIVTATATANGKTSSASTEVTREHTGTVTVKEDFYVGYDSRIQAEVTGDITKVYLEVDGVRKSTIPVTGSFEYYAKGVITNTNQVAYLVGLDASNQELDRKRVTLKDGDLKVGTITPNTFVVGGADSYVRGTYTGSVVKVGLVVNGTLLTKIPVGTDGTFQYYARTITNAATDEVYAIGYNSENLEIARTRVPLVATIAETTINALTTDSVKAEGTAEPNVDIVIKDQNNTQIGSGKVGSDGNYSITIPKQAVGTVVTATATKNGQTKSANTTVTQENLAPTTINALTTDSVKAEGTAEPNAAIVIKDQNNNQLASGVVQANGTYSLTIPKQPFGTVVTATATKNEKSASASTTVTQGNLAPTTIGELTTDSTVAEGTAEPNATIVIKDQNNNQLASGRVSSDGTYYLIIPKQVVGTVVTATATANGKNASASTTVTQGGIAPTTIGKLTTDSTSTEGTAEPNATIVIKDQNNNQLASGRVAPDGTYFFRIPKQAVGTVITATATANGKTASAHTTVTQENIAKTTINALTTDSIKAEGTAEPNADIAIKIGGTTIATGKVDANGNYSLVIPKQVAGTVVTATASKNDKVESDSTTVAQGNIAPTMINALTTDSTSVEGTAEPNATIVIKDQNDNQLASGRVGSDGVYYLMIPKQAVGTVVTATATLSGKTSSDNTTVTQGNIAKTTINALNTDSVKAEGTAEPNATIVFKDQNNNQIASGVVQANGTYSVTIPKQAFGTVVTATATKNGKTSSDSTTVTQENLAPTRINALTTDSVKAEGTAEPNATIVFKDQNNNQIASGVVQANGTYSVTIPKQAFGTVVTATATKNGKTSSDNTTVTQGDLAPTRINALTTDSVKAEGTAEPNATIVFKDQNNNQIASGVVQANGTYSVIIPKQAFGTVVTATATKNGKTSSDSTTVTQGDLAPTTINALNTDSVKAEGTAEPNADIVIKVGQTMIATGKVGSDGNYSLMIPKQAVGTIVVATATKNDKSASGDTTVTQGNLVPTTINVLTTDSVKAEGTAEPNAAIAIKVGPTTIATGTANASGVYSITIPKQAFGAVVTADATKNGKSSSANTTVTQGALAPTTINGLTTDSIKAEGTAEPNADITIKVGQTTIATGKVDSSGNYSVTIPKQTVGTIVSATATKNDVTSNRAPTTVTQGDIAPTTINALTTDSVKVEGIAEPNAMIVIKDQDNNQLASGIVQPDGTYSLTIPKQAFGTIVTATATKNGKSSSANTAVTQNEIAQTTINPLTTDSVKAEGTGEPNATIVIKDQNNNQIASGIILANGTYSIRIPKQAFGTVVTADATKNGKSSSANTPVTQGNIAATTINSLTTNSVKAEGTAEPNATIVFKDQNNNQIASGVVQANGAYSVTIPKQAFGTVVTATASKNGKTSSANTLVTQADIAPTTINPLTTDSVKVEGTAEPNATIVFKDQNNNQIASGVVQASGAYSVTIPKQAFGTVVTATASKNGKTSSANTPVTQADIAPTTINPLTTDSVKVEGTAEPNATIVFKDQNNNQIASGVVQANGTYSITIPKQAVNTVVTATASKNGKSSSANTSVTQADLAQTTINPLTTDSVKAEGTAEPNATIVFKDQNNNQIASGIVQANGTYSVTIPKQAFGTVVTASATAKGKTESANTTVAQGNIAPTTINALDSDSTKAEGTAEPNADVTIKVGNTTIATGKADASGHYSITIPKQAAGTVVIATATKNGKSASANTTVTRASNGTVTV